MAILFSAVEKLHYNIVHCSIEDKRRRVNGKTVLLPKPDLCFSIWSCNQFFKSRNIMKTVLIPITYAGLTCCEPYTLGINKILHILLSNVKKLVA